MRLGQHLGMFKYNCKREIQLFQGFEHHEIQSKPNPDDQPKEDDRIQASSENLDKTYWIFSVDEYSDEFQYGPEVFSPMAEATETFWQNTDILKA